MFKIQVYMETKKEVNSIDYWYQKYLKEKLTWKDASVIVTIAMDIIGEGEIHGEQNIYTEVLKRFNEIRKK